MGVDNLKTILWEEKYRPQNLKELIVPQRIRTIFENGVVQSMLLYGTAGIGKTSAAKAICKQFKHNTLYLNMSETTGVDTIRETIMEFALNQSILHYDNPIKVVILDEMDGMSQQAYAALRATMEKCSVNTRFIGTCNYIEKIPDPIQSRFLMIDFNFSSEEINEVKKGQILRVMEICKKEGLNISRDAVAKLVLTYYPDFRSIVKKLQRFSLEGKTSVEASDIKDSASEYAELYEMIITQDNPVENYKFVMKKYSNCVDEAIASLGYPFIEYILKSRPALMGKIPVISVLNAKYQQNLKLCVDPVVVLLANVYELQMEIQK
jgi:DNA polymerase III delta prime subunit